MSAHIPRALLSHATERERAGCTIAHMKHMRLMVAIYLLPYGLLALLVLFGLAILIASFFWR
jgi:hypothetical protein